MTAAESLYSELTGFAGLQALIGNGDSPETYRVYPLIMPQDDTRPAVVYQRITAQRFNTMSDSGGTGVERIVYQISSWATTLKAAEAVAEQVRLAMKAATSFSQVPLANRDFYEPDTKLYAVEYDFAIRYR